MSELLQGCGVCCTLNGWRSNRDPNTKYTGNFGAMLNLTFKKTSIGVRTTGESTQATLGFRF
jgi:hypothetical protein